MSPNRSTKQRAIDLLSHCDAIVTSELDDRIVESSPGVAFWCSSESIKLLKRNTIFVGSSRLPQKLDEIPHFFDGLLKLAVDLDPERDVLITATGTACDAMVRRIGSLFNIPVLSFSIEKSSPKEIEWQIQKLAQSQEFEILVFDFNKRGMDFVLSSVADQMTILSMRKNGNLHAAVGARLESDRSTRVLIEPSLTRKELSDDLLTKGATGWYLFGPSGESIANETDADVMKLADISDREFLLHWTRRRVGPWPDQNAAEYLDDLIFRSTRKDHREVAALRRILATERIFAGNDLTRDARKVVCFSNCRLDELKERRKFRSHLSRWDFEPYGIAICKQWLASIGCREVIYGDESVWNKLNDSERPFFQLNDSSGKVDWSEENEWRILGDLDLRKVPVDAAVVFVESLEDAKEVADVCRWPIVALKDC